MRHREHGCVYADIDLVIGWLSRGGDTRRTSVQSDNRRATTGKEALAENAQRGGLPDLHRLGHTGIDRAGGIAGGDARAAQRGTEGRLGIRNRRACASHAERLYIHSLEYIARVQAQIAESVAPGIPYEDKPRLGVVNHGAIDRYRGGLPRGSVRARAHLPSRDGRRDAVRGRTSPGEGGAAWVDQRNGITRITGTRVNARIIRHQDIGEGIEGD